MEVLDGKFVLKCWIQKKRGDEDVFKCGDVKEYYIIINFSRRYREQEEYLMIETMIL